MSKETCPSCLQEVKWLRQRSNRLVIILSVALVFAIGAILTGCKEKSPFEREFEREFERKCEISLLEEERRIELAEAWESAYNSSLPAASREQEWDRRFKEIWRKYDAKLEKARNEQ